MAEPRPVRIEQPPAPADREPTILVVDDDEAVRDTLEALLRRVGARTLRAGSAAEALQLAARKRLDLVFVDLDLPGGMSGLELLTQLRADDEELQVIVCTVDHDVRTAHRAAQLGAFDYLTKDPERLGELDLVVRRALAARRDHRELARLRGEVQRLSSDRVVLGRDPRFQQIVRLIERIADVPTTVLLTGESGTGKEVLARLLHSSGPRRKEPFVAVNLAAMPHELVESILFGHEKGAFTGAVRRQVGKFEEAHRGTLFLDEIGELPLDVQPRLLRALQEREIERLGGRGTIAVDVRVVVATNRDLEEAIRQGRFREDLFYRLNVIPVRVPPLRDRREDVAELVAHFARVHASRLGRPTPEFSPEALAVLTAHEWPGNVRELENLIERIVALNSRPWGVVRAEHLPIEYHFGHLAREVRSTEAETSDLLEVACATFERNLLVQALERSGWNKAETARLLGISYATIKKKCVRYGLDVPSRGGPR